VGISIRCWAGTAGAAPRLNTARRRRSGASELFERRTPRHGRLQVLRDSLLHVVKVVRILVMGDCGLSTAHSDDRHMVKRIPAPNHAGFSIEGAKSIT
jgi:hypothetical protein